MHGGVVMTLTSTPMDTAVVRVRRDVRAGPSARHQLRQDAAARRRGELNVPAAAVFR